MFYRDVSKKVLKKTIESKTKKKICMLNMYNFAKRN